MASSPPSWRALTRAGLAAVVACLDEPLELRSVTDDGRALKGEAGTLSVCYYRPRAYLPLLLVTPTGIEPVLPT